ncbi:response regulator [Merismopedia glauca]|uniref:Response regulator n=1 Tax=Merismopedia glauca CCAP 1448/3 TaxID=1296344 RepID=A0A2T1BXZ2_9CYAN|nr:response regulator [Merismopedia glauca]PSB00804.1 response regulator [Merismopedia glauca CCAP 1448/3]
MNPELDRSNKVSHLSILNNLSSSRSTGCLEIAYGSTKWNLFLKFGQLLSVDCSVQSLDQLIHRLRQLGCDVAAKAVNITAENSENLLAENLVRQEIDRLTMQGLLDSIQSSQISTEVTKEALESLLWLKEGHYKWNQEGLTPRLAAKNSESWLDLSKMIEYYQQRLQVWQKYITIVQSPHQRPYLTHHRFLEQPVSCGTLSPKAWTQIAQLMRGISLRDLARFLKQDELKIVQLLIPYIRENVICLREPSLPFKHLPLIPEPDLPQIPSLDEIRSLEPGFSKPISETKIYKIACIDDSPIILQEMERILGKNSKYTLTKIEDPIKASALIFRLKPDLILMDITMPDINGYKLCHLFRNSAAFEKTPIIMVTGNKGLIDKARARMVGATDYLTKPFTEAELLALVEKYLV